METRCGRYAETRDNGESNLRRERETLKCDEDESLRRLVGQGLYAKHLQKARFTISASNLASQRFRPYLIRRLALAGYLNSWGLSVSGPRIRLRGALRAIGAV